MRCPFALQKLEQYKKTRGTFHLGKISGSTGLNANGTRGSTANFPQQTDDLPVGTEIPVPFPRIGSLSKDDGNVNKNGKKATGLGPVYLEAGYPT